MLNAEKLKKEAFAEVQEIAEEGKIRYFAQIEETFSQCFAEARKELWEAIGSVYKTYQLLEKAGAVKSLEWIYISFLRTALLDGAPCYRIDFYDSDGYVSEIECSGAWGFYFIFDFYDQLKQQVMEGLKRRTRLKNYDINDILYSLSDSFRSLSDDLVTQLIHSMSSDFAVMASKEHRLKIMLGDYMDQAALIEEVAYV